MRKLLLLTFLSFALYAKTITPNEVYAQAVLIQDHVHFLLKYYGIEHNHNKITSQTIHMIKLKHRNAWQKSYEILVKINMLREKHGLSRIEPVGMEPVEHLNPDMVYGMTLRVLSELIIFEVRKDLRVPVFRVNRYENKTSLDVYNIFSHISASFDELNRSELLHNYVFAETMRIYDDLTTILDYLGIKDNTIPTSRLKNATPTDSLKISMKVLQKIEKLQRSVGIKTIDFSDFNKKKATSSDVYTIAGIIIAELQPIKAYLGLTKSVTPPALYYTNKVPADIEQLMGWNFRKLSIINNLDRR